MPVSFTSYAIVPAAGRGVRMGRGKLLMAWGDSTVLDHTLTAWRRSRVDHTIVVVHPDDRHVDAVCRRCGTEPVRPNSPPVDMKASIRVGLDHVARKYSPRPEDVWLIAPADMPDLAPSVVDRLLAAHRPTAPQIVVPVHAGHRGHPVLFPWPMADQISHLAEDEGVDRLIDRHPAFHLALSDQAIPADLDTPDDYRRLQRRNRPDDR